MLQDAQKLFTKPEDPLPPVNITSHVCPACAAVAVNVKAFVTQVFPAGVRFPTKTPPTEPLLFVYNIGLKFPSLPTPWLTVVKL
jgi:hypothetical protein